MINITSKCLNQHIKSWLLGGTPIAEYLAIWAFCLIPLVQTPLEFIPVCSPCCCNYRCWGFMFFVYRLLLLWEALYLSLLTKLVSKSCNCPGGKKRWKGWVLKRTGISLGGQCLKCSNWKAFIKVFNRQREFRRNSRLLGLIQVSILYLVVPLKPHQCPY